MSNINPANVDPAGLKRRSFIYRDLAALGAQFGEINGGAVPLGFGGTREAELASARRLALADLSVMPHAGFKGKGTAEWLTAHGPSYWAGQQQGLCAGRR